MKRALTEPLLESLGLRSILESAWIAIQVILVVGGICIVAGGMVLCAILAVAAAAGQLKVQNGWLFIPLAIFLWLTFLIHINKDKRL